MQSLFRIKLGCGVSSGGECELAVRADISRGVAGNGSGYPRYLAQARLYVMSLWCRSGPFTIGSSQCSYFDYQSPCMALKKFIRMEQYAATMCLLSDQKTDGIGSLPFTSPNLGMVARVRAST